jgi:GntR family transcriptional regulator/MocR family aminotransferase
MREGHFARHISRMRVLYGERRTVLVESIAREFGEVLEVLGAQAGMHLAVTLPRGFRDQEIAASAARKELWLYPLSPAYLGETPRQGFILGFGSTRSTEIPHKVRQLKSILVASGNLTPRT